MVSEVSRKAENHAKVSKTQKKARKSPGDLRARHQLAAPLPCRCAAPAHKPGPKGQESSSHFLTPNLPEDHTSINTISSREETRCPEPSQPTEKLLKQQTPPSNEECTPNLWLAELVFQMNSAARQNRQLSALSTKDSTETCPLSEAKVQTF